MLLFFKNSRYWLAAAAAFALTGCAAVNGAYGESPNLQLVDATELPPPLSATEVALGEYVIGPGDEVSVNVFGVEDMSVNDARVDGSGRISVSRWWDRRGISRNIRNRSIQRTLSAIAVSTSGNRRAAAYGHGSSKTRAARSASALMGNLLSIPVLMAFRRRWTGLASPTFQKTLSFPT